MGLQSLAGRGVLVVRVAINVVTENPNRPSGALGYYINTVRELADIAPDVEFQVIASRGLEPFFDFTRPNMRLISLPYSNEATMRRVSGEHFLLPWKLKRAGTDVLNTGNIAPMWVPCKLVATVKTMHAFTTPDALSPQKRLYRKVIGNQTVKRADLVIANSESNRSDIAHYFGVQEERIRIVYEALDHGLFYPAASDSESEESAGYLEKAGIRHPFVLFVSSFWRYKNAEVLIRATAEWREKHPDLTCVLVGYFPDRDYEREMRDLARSLGVEEQVKFAGGLPQSDIVHLYRTALALVYPSRYETFGLPLLEAMACGCPVVAADASSLPEIAGDAGLLFDPDQQSELVERVIKLLEDSEYRSRRIELGIKRAREFSWRRTAAETLDVYRDANAI